jgi:DNA polymerase-4
MRGPASILHADLDAFFASVEQRDDPRLRGRPVAVGGGVVLAASYEARAYGVRSAMGGRRARALCPHLLVAEPRWSAYVEASRAVFALFAAAVPVVEALSIDEAFHDARGLERITGTPVQIAERLRREVLAQVGLPLTVGVARTKSLAKVASGVAKPDGLLVVEPEDEEAFLHPLDVGRLWGVGPVTRRRLAAMGVTTVGDLARRSEDEVVAALGRAAGRHVHALAHRRDPRPVRSGTRRRSVGAQSALPRGTRPGPELDTRLAALVDRVARRMRRAGRAGRTVVVRLRFDDFTRATRSRTLPEPTAGTADLLAAARGVLAEAAPLADRRGLTLLGVTVTNLEGAAGQLALPLDGPDHTALEAALDRVRDRFGAGAVTRGTLVGAAAAQPWLMPGEEPDELPGAPPRGPPGSPPGG